MFDGLKDRSVQVATFTMGFLFILFGTTWLSDFNLEPIAKAVIMITVAILLGLELGLKRYTSLSDLKKAGLQQYISGALVFILLLGAVLNFANVDPGQTINSINNFLIGIGSLFLVIEALF